MALAPDGAALVAAGDDGLVREFAVEMDGWSTGKVEQGAEETSALAFGPAGNVLAAGDSAGKLQLFRVADGKLTLLHSAAADSAGDQNALAASSPSRLIRAERGWQPAVVTARSGCSRSRTGTRRCARA